MLIYLQGLLGFSFLTFILIARGKAMINRANQDGPDALKTYKKQVGRGMVVAGLIAAAMDAILLIMLVFEIAK
ncbi:MAG: hypothetical protein H6656_20295 [Ardenticatenaceae bacterium]|nr:hypothetical protein [Anaerolineales bacterium]MCB9009672.1 hypothetical protein [Ardenticatenaceae bacterium]